MCVCMDLCRHISLLKVCRVGISCLKFGGACLKQDLNVGMYNQRLSFRALKMFISGYDLLVFQFYMHAILML